jgi:PTH2 family peptidyl-tRNA hydrolase
MSKVKQVLVYRRELTMRKGKMAAQCGHGVMGFLHDRGRIIRDDMGTAQLIVPLTDEMALWWENSYPKIVLCVQTEEDLMQIYLLAGEANIPRHLVTDLGHTEFKEECPDCKGKGVTTGRGETYWSHGVTTGMELTCDTCEGEGKIPCPTNTAVALGPALASEIDKITGPEGAMRGKVRMP